jgi:hypothetical protein
LGAEGLVEFIRGDLDSARAHFEAEYHEEAHLGDTFSAAETAVYLARVARLQGEPSAARHWLRSALTPPSHYLRAKVLDEAAALSHLSGDHEQAVRLCSCADTEHNRLGFVRPPYAAADVEQLVLDLRGRLGVDTFARLWSEGRQSDPDELIGGQV